MVEPGIGGSNTIFCLQWPTREVVELYQLLYLGTANVMSSDPPCRNGKAGFTTVHSICFAFLYKFQPQFFSEGE